MAAQVVQIDTRETQAPERRGWDPRGSTYQRQYLNRPWLLKPVGGSPGAVGMSHAPMRGRRNVGGCGCWDCRNAEPPSRAQEKRWARGEIAAEHVIRPALRDYQDDPEKWAAEHAPDKEE